MQFCIGARQAVDCYALIGKAGLDWLIDWLNNATNGFNWLIEHSKRETLLPIGFISYLRVEKSGEPEAVRFCFEEPVAELLRPVEKLSEPKPDGRRLPRRLVEKLGDWGWKQKFGRN